MRSRLGGCLFGCLCQEPPLSLSNGLFGGGPCRETPRRRSFLNHPLLHHTTTRLLRHLLFRLLRLRPLVVVARVVVGVLPPPLRPALVHLVLTKPDEIKGKDAKRLTAPSDISPNIAFLLSVESAFPLRLPSPSPFISAKSQ